MKFATFSEYLQRLEKLSSRLEMTALLAELLKKFDEDEVTVASYLLQGQLLPPYASLEFQIAVKTVIKALARLEKGAAKSEGMNLFGEDDFSEREQKIEKEYRKLGDLGLVTESLEALKNVTTKLSVVQVYEKLLAIAKEGGAQSQQRKLHGLVDLLQEIDAVSAKFVVRIILGRLRLGFSDMTMIDALSWAMTGGKSERETLEDAYQKKADIGKLAAFYLQQKDPSKRVKALQNYKVEVGVPVIPALCQRLNSAAEMIEKMHEVIAEPKYDGLRVQIHIVKKGPQQFIKTFTRNLEETSHMFPELKSTVDSIQCESCILDAEAIGYDPESGELLPFQQTVQRKRKHDVAEKAKEVPIRFYVFDLLYINGEDIIQQPLKERKEKLHKLFKDNDVLYHSPELRTSDPKLLHEYHEQELSEGLEGVVVKQIDSVYQSGRKGWSWVKMKETEGSTGKLADTLDVVVMGYYFGRGKRASFGIGAILVGILDEKNDKIVTIAKIGTGLTEEALRQTKERCDKIATKTPPNNYVVNKMLLPDVWCLPEFVVEVAADELTNSPLHSAGVALRFPRLVKFRDDKKWSDATTLSEVTKSIAK